MKKNNKGFTLVELLVVIAIIGILAVVAVPALFKNIEKGKVADLEADISAIRSAALSVYADTSEFPEEGNLIGNTDHALMTELEGLSNPFNATGYTINNTTDTDTEKLILEITLPNKISAAGISKLKKDLGTKVIVPSSNAGSKEIKIELISK